MIEPLSIELGALENAYRIRRQSSWSFLALFTLGTLLMIAWLIRYVNASLCIPVPLFIYAWVVAEFFIKRRTELKIYENGLTYQRLFKKHIIFWDEVEEYGHQIREDYETADLRDEAGNPIPKVHSIRGGTDWVWLQKHDGEKFYLRADLENMKGIIDHISMKLYGEPYYGKL
jgi:hypothetical protein